MADSSSPPMLEFEILHHDYLHSIEIRATADSTWGEIKQGLCERANAVWEAFDPEAMVLTYRFVPGEGGLGLDFELTEHFVLVEWEECGTLVRKEGEIISLVARNELEQLGLGINNGDENEDAEDSGLEM